MASYSSRRALSERLVVDQLREGQKRSVADIASASGLSRGTVASVLSTLRAQGLVTYEQAASLGVGRPARTFSLISASGYVGAIDVGHTHVATAVADTNGRLMAESRADVDADASGPHAIDSGIALLRATMEQVGVRELSAATMGIPGPVNRADAERIVSSGMVVGWQGVAPVEHLVQQLPHLRGRVSVENEVHLGAVAEHAAGAGRGYSHLLYIKVSAGIGSGTIIDNRLFRGAQGAAGEIGHVRHRENGILCRCGGHGCLETVATTSFAVEALSEIHRRALSLDDVQHLLAQGDSITVRLIRDIGRDIGQVVAGVASHLDPHILVIGGPLTDPRNVLVAGVTEAIESRIQPFLARRLQVKAGELGGRAPLLGAVKEACRLAAHLSREL